MQSPNTLTARCQSRTRAPRKIVSEVSRRGTHQGKIVIIGPLVRSEQFLASLLDTFVLHDDVACAACLYTTEKASIHERIWRELQRRRPSSVRTLQCCLNSDGLMSRRCVTGWSMTFANFSAA